VRSRPPQGKVGTKVKAQEDYTSGRGDKERGLPRGGGLMCVDCKLIGVLSTRKPMKIVAP